jgi:hypothetical protein
LSRHQGHSAAGRIWSIEKSDDLIRNLIVKMAEPWTDGLDFYFKNSKKSQNSKQLLRHLAKYSEANIIHHMNMEGKISEL